MRGNTEGDVEKDPEFDPVKIALGEEQLQGVDAGIQEQLALHGHIPGHRQQLRFPQCCRDHLLAVGHQKVKGGIHGSAADDQRGGADKKIADLMNDIIGMVFMRHISQHPGSFVRLV